MKKIILILITVLAALLISAGVTHVEDAGVYKVRPGDWFITVQASDTTTYRGSYDSLKADIDSLNHARILSGDSLSAVLRDTVLSKLDSTGAYAEAAIHDSLNQNSVRMDNYLIIGQEVLEPTLFFQSVTGCYIRSSISAMTINCDSLSVPSNFHASDTWFDSTYVDNDVKVGNDITVTGKISGVSQVSSWLPDTLATTVGDTIQIMFSSVFAVPDIEPYAAYANVDSDKGYNFARYWEYSPVIGDLGTDYKAIFEIRDHQSGYIMGLDTTIVKVMAGTGIIPSITTILPVGDSWSTDSTFVYEYWRRLAGTGGTPAGRAWSSIETIGDKGYAPNQRVAIGGWNWGNYIAQTTDATEFWFYTASHDKDNTDKASRWEDTNMNQWTLDSLYGNNIYMSQYGHSADPPASGILSHVSGATHTTDITFTSIQAIDGNPFWDYATTALSFTAFITRNGFSDPDVMIPLLGINDIDDPFVTNVDSLYSSTAFDNMRTFLDQFHTDYPSARVLVATFGQPNTQYGGYDDLRGTKYGGNFGWSISFQSYIKALEMQVKATGYKDYCNIAGSVNCFDRDFSWKLNPVLKYKKPSTRYSGYYREIMHYDGIHPNEDGYYQIADQVYREFVKLFAR